MNCVAVGGHAAGVTVFAGCWDKHVYCWDRETGTAPTKVLRGHADFVKAVVWTMIAGKSVS